MCCPYSNNFCHFRIHHDNSTNWLRQNADRRLHCGITTTFDEGVDYRPRLWGGIKGGEKNDELEAGSGERVRDNDPLFRGGIKGGEKNDELEAGSGEL